MKTAGYSSFLVLDADSLELAGTNRIIEMNNENRIFVVNFDEQIDLILPEQTPDNKEIKIVTHGNISVLVRVYPFGTTEAEIGNLTGLLAEINGISPTTLTFQFLNGVTYVTKSVGSSDVVETEVSFAFAQIRAMGTTPLELLVAPGAGKYNSIDSIIQEYKHVGTPYTAATASLIIIEQGAVSFNSIDIAQLTASVSSSAYLTPSTTQTPLNTALTATTDDASDLTLGTGTLKFIISYKIRTVA
jgi:hypothetical protein